MQINFDHDNLSQSKKCDVHELRCTMPPNFNIGVWWPLIVHRIQFCFVPRLHFSRNKKKLHFKTYNFWDGERKRVRKGKRKKWKQLTNLIANRHARNSRVNKTSSVSFTFEFQITKRVMKAFTLNAVQNVLLLNLKIINETCIGT